MSLIKAYKGFHKDMRCRGFQYVEGKTYELPNGQEAELCKSGFHACEAPIDCFNYYAPGESVYHKVKLDATDEKQTDDSKRVGRMIKIGAKLNIKNIVDAQIEFVKEHTVSNGKGHSTGDRSANSATGDRSANSATGNRSANSATGYGSANSATGDRSANSATGDWSANSATGYGSANVTTGDECTNSGGAGVISVGWGKDNKCKGDLGAYIVLCERDKWNGETYPLIGEPVLIKIDGEKYKADTWYMLKNGSVVEAQKEE